MTDTQSTYPALKHARSVVDKAIEIERRIAGMQDEGEGARRNSMYWIRTYAVPSLEKTLREVVR